MKGWKRTKAGVKKSQPVEFDWREIRCVNRETAEAEVRRQQQLDDTDKAEWIYLRNKDGQWVARRTPRVIEMSERPTSRWGTLRAALIDDLHIEDLFS